MKKLILSIVLISSLLTSCSGLGEEKRILDTFEGYKRALLDQNGLLSVDFVTKETIALYQQYLDWAKTATGEELAKLSLINQIQVILIRHSCPQDVVLELDGKGIFIYAVDRGWIDSRIVVNAGLTDVTISANKAHGFIVQNGVKTAEKFHFIKQDGKWRFDLSRIISEANSLLAKMVKESGMTEKQFIISCSKAISNETVSETIWDPMVAED